MILEYDTGTAAHDSLRGSSCFLSIETFNSSSTRTVTARTTTRPASEFALNDG